MRSCCHDWCGHSVGVYGKKLIATDCRPAHVVRLKFYNDEALNMTEVFLAHVVHNSEGIEVEAILEPA